MRDNLFIKKMCHLDPTKNQLSLEKMSDLLKTVNNGNEITINYY